MRLPTPPNREDYIFAQKNRRERTAVNRLVVESGGSLGEELNGQLGWNLPWAWLGLRIPQRRLLRGIELSRGEFTGDVDVLGGSFTPNSRDEYRLLIEEAARTAPPRTHPSWHHLTASYRLLETGRMKWPPDLSVITAAEFKASYYSAGDDLKATGMGSQHSDRKQARDLCRMGFDRVALARLLVTEPVPPGETHPWIEAGDRGGRAADEMRSRLHAEGGDPFGTLLFSVGAVEGGLEYERGSITLCEPLRQVPENPLREKSLEMRKAVERNLHEVMSRYQAPRGIPALVLACSDDACGHLYLSIANPDSPCPSCAEAPR